MKGNPNSVFVDGNDYNSPDIICHKGAVAPASSLSVSPGCKIQILWSQWPENHRGPILDYLAPCGDRPCKDVPKEELRFTKIREAGIIEESKRGSNAQGRWYVDELRENNFTWPVTIPEIKDGEYTLRTEIIALHDNGKVNGAQHYPMCFTLKVEGGGKTQELTNGVKGTELYTIQQKGIAKEANIYVPQKEGGYPMPGPPLWTSNGGGSSGSGNNSTSDSSDGDASYSSKSTSTSTTTKETTTKSGTPSSTSSSASSSASSVADSSKEECRPETVTSIRTVTVTATPSAVSYALPIHCSPTNFLHVTV